MKNKISKGDVLEFPAPAGGILSGAFAMVGALYGVAVKDGADGVVTPFDPRGVFSLPKETGAAWSAGDQLYWDATNKRFTKTSSGNTAVGVAYVAAQSADAVGNVFLR